MPTEHLDTFDEKFNASLKRIADEGLDMDRMAMVISRDERQLRSKLESSQGDTFSGNVITDALYGAEDGSNLAPSMDEIKMFVELKQWTSQQWADLLRKSVFRISCVSPTWLIGVLVQVLRGPPAHRGPWKAIRRNGGSARPRREGARRCAEGTSRT